MRRALLLGLLVASLGVVGPAAAADRVVERGIIQSLSADAVVLRALDGSEITVALAPTTRFRLNGRPVRLGRLGAGLVAEAVTPLDGGAAIVLRAFGRSALASRTGSVVRVGPAVLVLRLGGGGRARIAVTGETIVRRAGALLALERLRRGMRVRVSLEPDGTARLVRVLP